MLLLCRGRECGIRSGCRRGGRGEGRRVRTRAGRCRCVANRGGWFCRRCRHWGVGRRGCGCLEGRRALVTLDWLCGSMTQGQLNIDVDSDGSFVMKLVLPSYLTFSYNALFACLWEVLHNDIGFKRKWKVRRKQYARILARPALPIFIDG